MKQESKANIFIIDDSFNNEEKIVKIMRSAGLSAHMTRAEDDEDLIKALKKQKPDILLYSIGMELMSLEETIACLTEHAKEPIPVIAVSRPKHEGDIVKVMRAGAKDLSSYDTPAHIELVIHREINSHKDTKKLFALELANKETEKRCAALLDSSRDAIAYIHEGMHVYSNSSYLEQFGFEEGEEIEGMPVLDMIGLDDRDNFKKFLRENYSSGSYKTEKLKASLKKVDGTEFSGEMEFSAASIDGEPCIQLVIRHQADTKELEEKLQTMSQKDAVTGLYNRQFFLKKLDDIVTSCKNSKNTASTLLVHLDSFEDIKKMSGVAGSDNFLNEISRSLEDSIIENDILAHFEGCTFIILAMDLTAQTVNEYSNKIRKTCQDFIANINGHSMNSTCTIGVSLIDENIPDSAEALLRAERALQQALEKGPNQLVVYQPKEGELSQKEIDAQVVRNLKDAITNNRFVLHYQPVISLHGDTDERYEVFVRMLDQDNQIVMPGDFLPAAERTSMSLAIDRWVLLNTIIVLTKRWKEKKRTIFFLKLTATSLNDTNLMSWLTEQLKKYNVPKDSLIFEVKESTAMTSLKFTAEIAKQLKILNCGFTIDDFGTGSNPFELLKHIPADYIKLERSFMKDLATSTENQETLKHITETAMEMNKLTIAQCVEDASSLSVLWGMGINFIQGNFLQEPSPDLHYDFTSMTG